MELTKPIPEFNRISSMYDKSWSHEMMIDQKSWSPYNKYLGLYISRTAKLTLRHSKADFLLIEYGIGDGRVTKEIIEQLRKNNTKFQIKAFDISQVAIDHCNNLWGNFSNFKAFKVNKTEIPIPDNSADVLLASEVFEHLYDPDVFLAEVKRVLKRGGILILTTPNETAENFFYIPRLFPKKIRNWLARRQNRYTTDDEKEVHTHLKEINDEYIDIEAHVYVYTPKKLKHLIEDSKFKVIKLTGATFLVPFIGLFNRTRIYRIPVILFEKVIYKIPWFNSRMLKTTILAAKLEDES